VTILKLLDGLVSKQVSLKKMMLMKMVLS